MRDDDEPVLPSFHDGELIVGDSSNREIFPADFDSGHPMPHLARSAHPRRRSRKPNIGETLSCGAVGRIKNRHAPKQTVVVDGINRPGSPKRVTVEIQTATAYSKLVEQARRDGFAAPLFAIVSAFRDEAKQASLFREALLKYGSVSAARKWVAPPGNSMHATGCALDLWLGFACGSETDTLIRNTDAFKWMTANAGTFGFNAYDVESWHWEFNVNEDY